MQTFSKLAFAFVAVAAVANGESMMKKHHKKHHKKHLNMVAKQEPKKAAKEGEKPAAAAAVAPAAPGKGGDLVDKIQKLEGQLDHEKQTDDAAHPHTTVAMQGKIDVNGPLPADFDAIFKQSAAKSEPLCAGNLNVVEKNLVTSLLQTSAKSATIVEVKFEGTVPCVHAIQQQAAEATSAFVNGPMFDFLVAKTDAVEAAHKEPEEHGVNVDTEMPFGTLEPFGREDTAEELTEDSVHESDAMVDQMERAEVAEEKRSVFRALTRLRGAAITSFDGVARSQTGNIDEYNKMHKWRKTHPLHHLAADEADTAKWAFPDQADF